MDKRQYFVVGASYGSSESQLDRFVHDGIWALGWSGEDQPGQYAAARKMKSGDLIAVKRRNGRGASDITILARGIVRGIIAEAADEKRFVCTVDWFETGLEVLVPMKHKTIQSVAGPFVLDDDRDWLVKVFGL